MHGLDAGCGRGGSSFIINRQFGCKIEGITLSEHQAKFASKIAKEFKVENSVRFHRANMLDLPFPPFTFDFIWACESTEHIPDLERMLKEFNRVGKKDCKLIIIAGCANPKHPKGRKFIEVINEWYHMCIHTTEEYLKLADKQGWQLERNLDLTPETIPYWDLRGKSRYKTGVEKLNWAYKVGAGEYRLFTFQKRPN
jgi:geranyl diphosphate 2-C-methyltransferase